MEIIELNEVESTQIYLQKYIEERGYIKPLCIVTQNQTNGIGSRGNSWSGKKGNLFFSFVVDKSYIPSDLQIQSSSIYFSYILKQELVKKGSKIWFKWPNDFYIDDRKIGGTITSHRKELLYCGIGLNLVEVCSEFGCLDIRIVPKELLEDYFLELDKRVLWKNVFSQFKIEFERSKFFSTRVEEEKISLKNSVLNSDGSINIGIKRVCSLR